MNPAAPPAGGRPDPRLRPARALRTWSSSRRAPPPTPRSSASTPPPTSPRSAATAPTPPWRRRGRPASGASRPGRHAGLRGDARGRRGRLRRLDRGRAGGVGRAAPASRSCAGGGLHHAFVNRAAGFCVYNDTAVAIQALLDAGAERVAYIDIDVHHGDGDAVDLLRGAPRADVLGPRDRPLPVPRHGRDGRAGDRRGRGDLGQRPAAAHTPATGPTCGRSRRSSPRRCCDFAPDVIVTQDGADPHHADPLAHLQVTMPAFPRAYRALHELAREPAAAAGWRWAGAATRSRSSRGRGRCSSPRCSAWSWTTTSRSHGGTASEQIAGVPLPRHLSDDPEPEVPLARADAGRPRGRPRRRRGPRVPPRLARRDGHRDGRGGRLARPARKGAGRAARTGSTGSCGRVSGGR